MLHGVSLVGWVISELLKWALMEFYQSAVRLNVRKQYLILHCTYGAGRLSARAAEKSETSRCGTNISSLQRCLATSRPPILSFVGGNISSYCIACSRSTQEVGGFPIPFKSTARIFSLLLEELVGRLHNLNICYRNLWY